MSDPVVAARKKRSGRAEPAFPAMNKLLIGAGLVFLDQAAKLAADKQLYQNESIPVIPQIFHITLVYNTGTAFGLFHNQNFILAGAAVMAIAALVYLYARAPQLASGRATVLWQNALLCILCGAVGNLIDRIRLGYVVDFIDLRVWPVFNIADSLITIGVVLLLLVMVFDSPGRSGTGSREHTGGTDAS